MKKQRLLLSGISILLVLCLLAGGTMAWFTDTEKVQGDFAAGVLDITLKPGEDTAAPLAFENLRPMNYDAFKAEINEAGNGNNNVEGYAPLPQYFQPVVIQNKGTLPVYIEVSAKALAAGEIDCAKGGEKKLEITTDEKGRDTVKQIFEADGKTNVRVPCTNGLSDVLKIVLFEKAGDVWTVVSSNLNPGTEGEPYAPGVVLPAATGEKTYVVGAYLPQDTGNAYQAKHFHGNIVVKAFQTDEGAGAPSTPDVPESYTVTVTWLRDGKPVGTSTQKLAFTEGQETAALTPDPAKLPKDFVLADPEASAMVDKTALVASFEVKRPGDGSGKDADNSIWIETAEDLDNVRDGLDKFYKLGADIDLSDYESWEPIGVNKSPFTGVFDGNGYQISGLNVRSSSGGLFGYVKGDASDAPSVLKNITIKDPQVRGSSVVGALAGSAENARVASCVAAGGSVTARNWAGGLIGYSKRTTVTGSSASCTVIGLPFGEGYFGLSALGGLIGMLSGGTVEECFTSGETNAPSESPWYCIGGLIGCARGDTHAEIRNCYSTGRVNGGSPNGGIIGGIDGDGDSMGVASVQNCFTVSPVYTKWEGYYSHPAIGGRYRGEGAVHGSEVYYQTENYYVNDQLSTDWFDWGSLIVGKTEDELKQSSTYAGWDTDVWNIVDGAYPTLKGNSGR
ncbi:TasA family protein [Anaeromassilibacillus senegalensis]|uniref:TasA family protein n=1 Tax=Anaeromassilibacillus senegalensis TaxID=1673717 RepID=UPI0006812D20|nr:TasA family protein [Anaeromassilibacillus senegalensis]